MARAVILRFASNKDAEEFVRQQYSPDGTGITATVEAVIGVPTKHCVCRQMTDESTGRKRRKRSSSRTVGWTRGTTYGWWLCDKCHRPSAMMVRHFISAMLVGANDLLPQILGIGPSLSSHDRWRRDGGIGKPELKMGDHYEHL